jgi:hypothetical protein
MKLNENGDFCLLYVEPTDEKQTLFETIGAQNKPVVLMLPLAPGQARSKLFQRPEDFSDLKHMKRQTGTAIIFVTAGSERLAQLATRYGFPAYATIDAFAEELSNGRKSVHEENGSRSRSYPARFVRTGPLVPSAIQLAAIQRAMPSTAQTAQPKPSNAEQDGADWLNSEKSPVLVEHAGTAPFGAPTDLAFWPDEETRNVPNSRYPTPRQGNSYGYRPPASSVPETSFFADEEVSGVPNSKYPTPRQGNNSGYRPPASSVPATSFFADEEVSGVPNSKYPTPRKGNSYGHHPPAALAAGTSSFEEVQPSPSRSEVPSRRPALLPNEHYTQQEGWESEEPRFETPPLLRTQRAPSASTRPSRAGGSHSMPDFSSSQMATQRPAPDLPSKLPEPPLPEASHRPPRGSLVVLIILSLLILGGAGLGSLIAVTHATPNVPTGVQPVGTISFISSGQLDDNSSQGINDEIQINLHSLGMPASDKSYYAWLLGDKNQTESQSILLGKLTVVNGSASLLYRGDAQHTNLLQSTSRFLITEESSSATPILPSPDTNTWRYYGEIPATPDPREAPHFAFLNHLRHLLADEPVLDELELPGGLNKWFTLNTQELVQWAASARDLWQNSNFSAVRNQGIRILSYLDGMSFLVQDLPAASVNAKPALNARLAGLGLINILGSGQNPPSYIDQLAFHLNGLINAPGAPSNIRSIATGVQPVMGYVNAWLQSLRNDTKQLLAMDDYQLSQQAAFSILDDMVSLANNAYTGATDPSTGQFKAGVSWIHEQLQALATINISTYVAGGTAPEMGPSSPNTSSSFLPLLSVAEKGLLGDVL